MAHYCHQCSTTVEEGATACPACTAPAPDLGFARDDRIGALVAGDQYRVLRRLGAGGFGVVYEVETMVGGLRRALKVLGRRWAEDPEVQQRFVNEALVLEQVTHPNVARCFAAGRLDDGGDLYLLFELIDGVQLARLIQPRGAAEPAPFEPARATRLARQIAAALQAAHAAGILHRDLKPENILVTDPDTGREQARVVDFGIAKLTEQGSTSTQSIVGTPEYMPPEQFLPGTPLDSRVDLWQLGALLYTMLTGRPPYAGLRGGIAAIMAEQGKYNDRGPAPSEVVPALAEHTALDDLVSRLLASDPDRRPESAAVVCEDLARIEHGLSGTAGDVGPRMLLAALCASPSESSWVALQRYLEHRRDDGEALVPIAERMLAHWPDALRRASIGVWEPTRRGRTHLLWPLVRSLDLSARGLDDDDLRRLAELPALATITRLDLSRNDIGNDGVAALAASPHLGALAHLDLGFNRVSSQGLETLVRSPAAGRLRSLGLAHNGVGARGMRALAEAAVPLAELDLRGNDLGAEGAAALAEAEALAGLRILRLADCGIGADGVAALARSPHLARLEDLDLDHTQLGPEGAAVLAAGTVFPRLRALHLARNGLGRQGVQQLLRSTGLDDLERLDLSGNGLGATGAMLVAAAPFVRRLRALVFDDNELGDAGLAALLGSPHLGALAEIGLAQNGITAAGAGLLADAWPQLADLDLSHNPIGDAGADAIVAALPGLRVTRLRVPGCGLGGDSVARILDAGHLVALDAARNPIGSHGAAAIGAAAGARTLDELDLSHAELGADGAAALAASPYLGALRALDLASNGLGDGGVAAALRHLEILGLDDDGLGDGGVAVVVTAAAALRHLEILGLDDNGLGPDAAEALAASAMAGTLDVLRLAHNELGDTGAEILARSPGWHSLRTLDLLRNGVGLAGAAAIASSQRLAVVERLELSTTALTGTLDVYALGQDAIELMEASFGRIAGLGADFAEQFYAELFARYPGVKPLFARTSMPRQHRHLMTTLVMVIDNLRNPEALEHAVQELGRRHVRYAVAPSHYYAVTSTLVDAMRAVYGPDWTPALHEAWTDGLDAVANVMMDAARSAAVRPAPTSDTVLSRPAAPPATHGKA